MRAALLALALVFTTIPATANEAPVAVASAPNEAVLNEPLVFTSLSFDPDGTIVSTTWEDSDGRERSGTSVTLRLPFPGVHTIVMRVRDDAGAVSSLSIPVLVHAPLMHGRAFALSIGEDRSADTGDIRTTQHSQTLATVGEYRNGQLRVSALDGQLNTHQNRAVARASVGLVHIPHPLGYFLITGVETLSIVGCDYPTLNWARFEQVRFNDGVLFAGEVPPNTAIAIPGVGSLELNVVEPVGDRVNVVAIRVTAPDDSVTEVAHAEAGVTHCPYI